MEGKSICCKDLLGFFQEAGFENNSAFALAALYLIFIVGQMDILKFRTSFEGDGRPLYLKVFNDLYRVALIERVSVAVFHVHRFFSPFKEQRALKRFGNHLHNQPCNLQRVRCYRSLWRSDIL